MGRHVSRKVSCFVARQVGCALGGDIELLVCDWMFGRDDLAVQTAGPCMLSEKYDT